MGQWKILHHSILSPEGFASILWKNEKRAKEAANLMKMTAKDLLDLGVIEKNITFRREWSIRKSAKCNYRFFYKSQIF
ncbi:MAG: hypothetical protein ACLTER_08240 [Ruminococcus sp.]